MCCLSQDWNIHMVYWKIRVKHHFHVCFNLVGIGSSKHMAWVCNLRESRLICHKQAFNLWHWATNGNNQNYELIFLSNIAEFIPLISSNRKFFLRNVIVKQPEVWHTEMFPPSLPLTLRSFLLSPFLLSLHSERKNWGGSHVPPALLGTRRGMEFQGLFPGTD